MLEPDRTANALKMNITASSCRKNTYKGANIHDAIFHWVSTVHSVFQLRLLFPLGCLAFTAFLGLEKESQGCENLSEHSKLPQKM